MKKCRIKVTSELLKELLKLPKKAEIMEANFDIDTRIISILLYNVGPEHIEGAYAVPLSYEELMGEK